MLTVFRRARQEEGTIGMRRWIAGSAVLLWLVVGEASGESLWRDIGRGFLFIDTKARHVGDIVTVLVTESSTLNRQAETNTKKESANSGNLSSFFGIKLGGTTEYAFEGANQHKGAGSVTRSDQVTAQVVARVVKVLPSGNLIIEGRRAVRANDEAQYLAISGVIRPEDITPANTILSSLVADAEIVLEGKGALAEKQRPGILNRFADWLFLY
jgi:flagellar L-ring protein precursor FlgH